MDAEIELVKKCLTYLLRCLVSTFMAGRLKYVGMCAKQCRSLALLMWLTSGAFAFPRPLRGTEDIPKMMAASALVCKGEVVEAPARRLSPSLAGVSHLTETANVHPDRCFKGSPNGSSIPVVISQNVKRGVFTQRFVKESAVTLTGITSQHNGGANNAASCQQ